MSEMTKFGADLIQAMLEGLARRVRTFPVSRCTALMLAR